MTRWLHRWLLVASIVLLGGCSALPRVVPDMARGSGEPQLQGGRGPLSAARSKEILDGLRAVLGPAFPIIGVGGVTSPGDAIAKREAGADIVQIYTGFIYQGPALVAAAARALAQKVSA